MTYSEIAGSSPASTGNANASGSTIVNLAADLTKTALQNGMPFNTAREFLRDLANDMLALSGESANVAPAQTSTAVAALTAPANTLPTPAPATEASDDANEVAEVDTSTPTVTEKLVTAREEKREPAVPISKSITPQHLVCLEDGKKVTMLKRYLRTKYNLTPEEYRTRWDLPADYPMVAPNYAEKRRELAKSNGLGRFGRVAKGQGKAPATDQAEQGEPVEEPDTTSDAIDSFDAVPGELRRIPEEAQIDPDDVMEQEAETSEPKTTKRRTARAAEAPEKKTTRRKARETEDA